jgi:tRNA(Ile)-lysidine synthase
MPNPPSPIVARTAATIQRFSMLPSGSRVLVAVSGGPDSVCLLSILHELTNQFNITLHVAHLDHGFRGEESAEDARFVSELAAKLELPATIDLFDVPAYCRERGLSAPEGAREVRYDFLERTAKAIDAAIIATGHTADDQAETFLMRLLRGAGPEGLASIPPKRGNIIRPLLEITRADIMRYLAESKLEYRTDSSNAKPIYTRNRVRLELVPVLKQFNPRIVETLANETSILRDEDAVLSALSNDVAARILEVGQDSTSVRLADFNALLQGLRRRVLKLAVAAAGFGTTVLSRAEIESALDFLAHAQTGKHLQLSSGIVIEREYERFVVTGRPDRQERLHQITIPGITNATEFGVTVDAAVTDSNNIPRAEANNLWQAKFDYDKMTPRIVLRNRRTGDWFCPAGMHGARKKLQDYFTDEKVPRLTRDGVPLLCSGDDIVWVVGHRADDRFLAGPATKRVLSIAIVPLEVNREM